MYYGGFVNQECHPQGKMTKQPGIILPNSVDDFVKHVPATVC